MKKLLSLLGALVGLLSLAGIVLYILNKRGYINIENTSGFFTKTDCCGEEEEETAEPPIELHRMEEPAPAPRHAKEPEKEKKPEKKEPVLKSGFSAGDFKL